MTAAPNAPHTYIIGHRNPDADAVCSAIAYAALKQAQGKTGYIAARCGNTNARIDTILTRFHQPAPVYLTDVTPRVRDVMIKDVVSVTENATCAEALELVDQHDVRVLPVISDERYVKGQLTIFDLGGFFVPKVSAPREMRKVITSLDQVARALKARVLNPVRNEEIGELFVRIGAMDVRSFWKVSSDENIPADRSMVIVGDRWDIQQRSIQNGVRALIITGNLPVEDEVVAQAAAAGVAILVSPHDTATTAWAIRTASSIKALIQPKFSSLSPDSRLSDLRKKLAVSSAPAFMVLNDDGRLAGILTKTDVLRPVKRKLILVDHNEMTQAVPGADQVEISEIIDHHRLGSLNTAQPILFINEPVGSTCTIVADLYRRSDLQPSADIAGIMMSGIISDTLHLNSPTSTEKDAEILQWLSGIAGVDSKKLADEIFASGSIILSSKPEAVIRSDHKIYEEDGVRFAVSQVEELGFGNFWSHHRPLAKALEAVCQDEKLTFACLLVTDINTQNSLLLVKGDAEVISHINYPHVEKDEIFDMPGIVSRKKQLIPFLGSVLKEMQVDGTMPSARGRTEAPFNSASA
ncbi:putative manganese-dependent inorganic diphosphatase [Synoicihabitans lomoniglobus]|uniref:inorganic diphosphatase n=1 Tax=Synoicihabitans lomoniglobus TaxID=2909285 RepID=A0AAF0CSA0_9BACT|nr:putative manganese-dependent inorganic diphosphatase [Opitutaceae bacterium LMO-M01]WED67102.1 putative manganese-dependent inorganic diphosphatase [Opitutaceae bacterium LMO-M01]